MTFQLVISDTRLIEDLIEERVEEKACRVSKLQLPYIPGWRAAADFPARYPTQDYLSLDKHSHSDPHTTNLKEAAGKNLKAKSSLEQKLVCFRILK